MDKNAIKKFAVWARRELITRVSQRAAWYGITEKDPIDDQLQAVHGQVLTKDELTQRRALINRVKAHGYQQTMEEVAYTWFNRFIALRFMEVNGYLPSRVRVFSDEAGAFNPQVLTEAIHVEIDGLDKEKVYALEEANEKEALFKYLIIAQCNELNAMLPGMFQTIADYTELLFPDYLLREGSVLHQMVTTIPEDDWKDAVQIIGWLYQYYNAERKDEVFAALKKNIKVSKDKIPAATQLFTPDWIVRYMVENSLGRLWVEGHPNDELKANWKYYLEEAPQEPEVETQLAAIRAQYAKIEPSQILAVDPCMGSGHILVYMFDVLMQIYLSYGYTTNEAVESIVRNNLWGLDIDDRCSQLAYFSVMMKARQYDRRWFSRHIEPNVFAIQDSPVATLKVSDDKHIQDIAQRVINAFTDGKEYGSILEPNVTVEELDALAEALDDRVRAADNLDMADQAEVWSVQSVMLPLIRQARALVQKYHVVVTNPPYMGSSGMGEKLSKFVKDFYPDSKSDLFAVFMERITPMLAENGYQAMITQHAWMFLSSYEKLRGKLQKIDTVNMAHLGARAFEEIAGEVVQTTSFVFRRTSIRKYAGTYCRAVEPSTQSGKEKLFLSGENRFTARQDNFSKIPGAPVAYWVTQNTYAVFEQDKIGKHYEVKAGISTGENGKFILLWQEVNFTESSLITPHDYLYTPHNKGGDFRKWYGNRSHFLKYNKKALAEMESCAGFRHDGREYYFQPHITWSKITSGASSFRFFEEGFTFDSAGLGLFSNAGSKLSLTTLALLNSKVCEHLLSILNPTLNVTPIIVKQLPYLENNDRVNEVVNQNIDLCKTDWDSFETSWDFKEHPLVRWSHALWDATAIAAQMTYYYGKQPEVHSPLELCYLLWQGECNERFQQLKANEEELNRIFIDIYGLQGELTPEVDDKDVTIRRADLKRDIKSLISYAVGCMLGRYSLDRPGLQFAGGDWKAYAAQTENDTYRPDKDGILPITEDEYFDDDIVAMFVEWVKTVYGADSLEENLQFIASALGGTGSARQVIRQYFLSDFFKDHCTTYSVTGSGKRPIYWLFDSGKKNGFKCLVYMHRYQPDTLARIRTDYVHEVQSRYRSAIETLERQLVNAGSSERVKLQKQLTTLKAKAEEVRVYEEKIHHLADQMIKIDLDDGVKHNYAIFQDVLAPIK